MLPFSRLLTTVSLSTLSMTAGGRAAHDGADGVTWVRAPLADRIQLDRWRAGVGPAVIHRGAGPARTVPQLEDLAVISWNTHVGGGDLHGLVEDLRAGRLTGGDSVHHFVLLLQEVYRAGRDVPRGAATRPRRIAPPPRHGHRSDIVDVARRHSLHLFYVPSMANGWERADAPAEDRGNAIVSTLPLAGLSAIELPFEGQRRVAARATITLTQANGHPFTLQLVSVHLDNRSGSRRVLRSFGSGRARQAEALVSALRSADAADLPTVLAGDLNTWAPSSWERAISVLRAHFPHGEPVRGATFAGPPLGVGRTLDHMMFRVSGRRTPPPAPKTAESAAYPSDLLLPEPRPRRLGDARGSDHYPLLAQFSLAALP